MAVVNNVEMNMGVLMSFQGFPSGSVVKNPLAGQETQEMWGGRWRLSLHVMLKDYCLGRIVE